MAIVALSALLLPLEQRRKLSAVFQHRGGPPPSIDLKPLFCFAELAFRGGPDRRRSGPHLGSRLRSDMRLLAAGLGGVRTRCCFTPSRWLRRSALRSPCPAPHSASLSNSIRRWAAKPIISRRNVASHPFSRSVRRAILSSVIAVILRSELRAQHDPTQDRYGGR